MLVGWKFLLQTDHNSLKWLHSFKEPGGQVERWLEKLASFQYILQHRPGKPYSNADALSQRIERVSTLQIQEDQGLEWDLKQKQQEDNVLRQVISGPGSGSFTADYS